MVQVSNADRIVFPEVGRTKGDVVTYYERIAPRLLPHVVGRPLSIRRYPKGLAAHAAYVAKLSAKIHHEGGVVIHHSTSAIHSTPVAFVAYDATTDSSSSAADTHFDENGVAFTLPQEALQSAVPSTRTSKK
jgi:hypothetical protein